MCSVCLSSHVLLILCDQPVMYSVLCLNILPVMKVGLGASFKHTMKEGHATLLREVYNWQQ